MKLVPKAVERGFLTATLPIAEWLHRRHVQPNTITTIGALLVVFSALAYGAGWIRWGGILLIGSGIVDTFDGQVARRGNIESKFGAFYDSTLDRVGDGVTFIGIAVFLLREPGVPWRIETVTLCMIAVLSSLLVSYARARAEGLGLECRVGLVCVGRGAVASTFIAGVELARRGKARPFGSLTQLATIRLGKRTEGRAPLIKDFVPLAGLDDLVFGAWDPMPDNAYQAALKCGVLDRHEHVDVIKAFLEAIAPMPAVFNQHYVKRLQGSNVKPGTSKRALAEALRQDIRDFKARTGCARMVVVWCASTEIFIAPGPEHETLAAFEKAMDADHPAIAPSMLYAWAALMEQVPFANGAPNLTVDARALVQLAEQRKVAIGGKDFKTGQTMVKTVLSAMLKARMLGVSGWYSTNILGNRDGEVLDDPESFKTKEESKLGVLEYTLQPSLYPELYGNLFHKVR